MTSPEPLTIDQAIKVGTRATIAALDRAIPPVIVRTPTDITDPVHMAFDAGRRSVVDMLIATLERNDNP